MAEEKQTQLSDIAQSIAVIVDKVPVYEDTVQPAAKQVGKSLELIARAIHAALKPLEAWIWSAEKLSEFVADKVGKKLKDVPPENIVQPSSRVAVPLLEALRYTGNDPELSEMYANLLANAMDARTAGKAHPAFVDMIKSMTSDEAKILAHLASRQVWLPYAILDLQVVTQKKFDFKTLSTKIAFVNFQRNISKIGLDAGCARPFSTPSYIDNLERLGLVITKRGLGQLDDHFYSEIERLFVDPIRKEIDQPVDLQTAKGMLEITEIGKDFFSACVQDKAKTTTNEK